MRDDIMLINMYENKRNELSIVYVQICYRLFYKKGIIFVES